MLLCDYCYGRIRREDKVRVDSGCVVCCDLFSKIDEIAERIREELKDYEFESFRVGSRSWGSFRAIQEYLGDEWDIKRDINLRLSERLSVAGKIHPNPDVVITFDPETLTFEFEIKPIFLFGRYVKRVRNISQTRWICRNCNGMGCEKCGYRGRKYVSSVEELIAEPLIRLFDAENAILHGAGREDVDARMLGNGRPFVMEIVKPRRRSLDLSYVEEIINKESKPMVKVRELKFVDGKEVARIKGEKFRKTYRAKVIFDREVGFGELKEALNFLSSVEIRQRTPKRVEHRRADKIRVKRVYGARILLHRGRVAVIEIDAEGGLYIKELVSGDEGRTKPSLSSLLNCEAAVEKLDVLDVYRA